MDDLIAAIELLDSKYRELNTSMAALDTIGRQIIWSAMSRLTDELRRELTGRA